MGQDLTKGIVECTCCGPKEDTTLEHRPPQPARYGDVPFASNHIPGPLPATTNASANTSAVQQPYSVENYGSSAATAPMSAYSSAWTDPQESEPNFFVPPPIEESSPQKQEPPPKSTPTPAAASSSRRESPKASTPAPSYAAAPAPAPVTPARSPSPKGPSNGVSFEAMLSDLEGAEFAAYGAAFNSLSGGQPAVSYDHDGLKSFVLIHSGIAENELDTELLKIASASDTLSIDSVGFVQLLQNNAVSESDALNIFLNASEDGATMTAETCRTCLLSLVTSPEYGLNANFPTDRAEQVFDTVMQRASLTVSMEEWVAFAKTAARITRVVQFVNA
eukprot:TRINITY_DN111937_c0_g1_i1.p1 TRINITY_DN111937_c0_g1~~TRINITY_DN111937_c0_g1_i1.p1  ORF type:complete len:334 (-),score=77.71 TRINITY_DN111937_c0_g1_i1:123-1124(-)